MYWHGSLENTRRTVEKIVADRAKGILVITGIGSTPCPLEGLKSTLDSITLNEMSFGPEEELFIDAKGLSMPSPGQAWGTKAFLVDEAKAQPTGDEALIRRVEAVPMRVIFEPKEGTDQPIEGIDVLSHAEIHRVVNYMRMGMHDGVAAKKRRAMVTSPHWWDDKMLATGKYETDEFVARVMDHIADQYDGPVGSDPPTWEFPRMGARSDKNSTEAANFRRSSVGSAPHDDEDGISDEEKSDSDPEEAYTAVRSVVSIPKQAAEEAQENPNVAELKERLINHQMPLHPVSRPCTAMLTLLGPMQWKVVPMGAKNGNAAFQRMMEDLLGPVRDCADPFVDDIIIGSGTEDMTEDELIGAHENDLRKVLSELDKHNMVCKPTKASLFVKEVDFAGHVAGHGQRRPMPG